MMGLDPQDLTPQDHISLLKMAEELRAKIDTNTVLAIADEMAQKRGEFELIDDDHFEEDEI